jgi:hypothetical protein
VEEEQSREEQSEEEKREARRRGEAPEEPHVASFSPHHAPGIEGDPVV